MLNENASEYVSRLYNENKLKLKQVNNKYATLEEIPEELSIIKTVQRFFDSIFFHSCREYILQKGAVLTRVVGVDHCDVNRIIPKKEFCTANRMNPKDKFYGYYILDYCGQTRDQRIKTGIKEIRAEKMEEVSSCEFAVVNKKLKLARFIMDTKLQLNIENNSMLDDLKKIKFYYNIPGGKKGKDTIGQIYGFNLMVKTVVESDMFGIVNGDEEREYHYAPFRYIADFLERKGYDGVLYQSTVDLNGYCVAIFKPEYIEAIGETLLCNIQVNKVLEV